MCKYEEKKRVSDVSGCITAYQRHQTMEPLKHVALDVSNYQSSDELDDIEITGSARFNTAVNLFYF